MGGLARIDRCALDWLRERRDKNGARLISEEEYAAGDRLRQDFTRARMGPRTTTNWAPAASGSRRLASNARGAHHSEAVSDAQERVRRALRDVGPDCAAVLLDVCCFELKLRDVERKAGWPQRSGKVILQLALRQLARFYGFIQDERQGGATPTRVLHWAVDDYRPGIDGSQAPENHLD
ncbi:MAG: DUF6456 domain-containing protein [Hyphomicrobiaceae bacterium]